MLKSADGFLTLIGDAAPVAADAVAYWDIQDVPAGAISVPRLVDENAEQLRDEYVKWSGSLAEIEFPSGTLAQILESRLLRGGSFWWTTLVAERSPVNCPQIYDVFRLRILERVFVSSRYRGLRYVGSDRRLHLTLRAWCGGLGCKYEWSRTRSVRRADRREWNRLLPHPTRALLYLGYILCTRISHHLRVGRSRPNAQDDCDLAILTYFPNIDLAALQNGAFRSHYWGPLHEAIESLGLRVHWLWFYTPSHQLSYGESVEAAAELNCHAAKTGQYFRLLEEYLTVSGFVRAIGEFVWGALISGRLKDVRRHFRFPGSSLNFFPILKDVWFGSLRGAEGLRARLYGAILREMVERLPRSTRRLIYLWENQGWEQSLLFACKASPGVKSIAVAHSNACTSPLHVRTCVGLDRTAGRAGRPLPDVLVAIGEQPAQVLRDWGWPREIVTHAEALRYMHLAGTYKRESRPLPAAGRCLLVVTGFQRAESEFQLRLLSASVASAGLVRYGRVIVKAHPDTPIDDLVKALGLQRHVEIANESIVPLLAAADVVYAANSTSVAVEAAWMGKPLILTAATDGLNLSPLNGARNACFVHSCKALIEALDDPRPVEALQDTYLLDADLRCWKRLIH